MVEFGEVAQAQRHGKATTERDARETRWQEDAMVTGPPELQEGAAEMKASEGGARAARRGSRSVRVGVELRRQGRRARWRW